MKKTFYLILSAVILLSSCKDFLTLVPKGSKVVTTVEDVKSELVGYWSACAYYRIPILSYGSASNLSLPFYNDVNTHLAIYSDDMDMLAFNNHQDISAKVMSTYYQDVKWKSLDLSSSMWSAAYCSIGFMNAVIDDLSGMSPTVEERETIIGEARLIRAWNLMKLLQFFAPLDNDSLGVPLNLSSSDIEPHPRSPQSTLYDFIEKEVEEVLSYSAAPQQWNIFYRKRFMYSFLADMYLFKASTAAAEDDDWERAEYYSSKALSGSEIEESKSVLRSLFAKDAFDISPDNSYCAVRLVTTRSNNIGAQYTGIWGKDNAQQPSAELWALYSDTDLRKAAWFAEGEEEDLKVTYIAKPAYESDEIGDLTILYRTAEMYLINCEAKCRMGRTVEAAEMLRAFREKRIEGYDGTIGDNVLQEVLDERRRELCFENGIRWLDMKRLGISCTRRGYSDKQTDMETYTLEANDYRFALPIPTGIEIDYNNIEQNPGWTTFE